MKEINLTLDNIFRNPFRWGVCPVNVGKTKIWGVKIVWGEKMVGSFKDRWFICFYYGLRFRAFSNYED